MAELTMPRNESPILDRENLILDGQESQTPKHMDGLKCRTAVRPDPEFTNLLYHSKLIQNEADIGKYASEMYGLLQRRLQTIQEIRVKETQEQSNRLRGLEEEKDQAEEALHQQKEETEVYRRKFEQTQAEMQSVQEKRDEALHQLEEMKRKIWCANQERDETRAQYHNTVQEMSGKIQNVNQEKDKMKEALEQCTNALEGAQNKITDLAAEYKRERRLCRAPHRKQKGVLLFLLLFATFVIILLSFAPYQHSITQVVAPKVPRVPKVLEVPKTTGVAKVPKTTEVTKVPKNKKAAKVPKNTEAAKAPELKLDIVLTSKAPPETSWLQTWIDARSSKALGLADNAPNISSSDIPESLTKVDPVAYLRPTRARDLIWLPDLTVPGLMWGP
ncbi:hypothetical protein TWF569_000242 [Orbilia oligospora]|nr:hypothetical protein TWF569_000242 [Orbilia oligospora]